MTFPEDQEILNLIADPSNRNEGFRYLVGKYKEKLYWHIRRILDNHEDADDVLQNTFMKVVRNIDGFQEKSTLFTWLFRIATNESLNFINARKNRKLESLDVLQNAPGDSQSWFDESSVLNHLRNAINQLPHKQKIVFSLRYYDEMPYQEIANITNTSVGALKASYHHAVRKIEEHIKLAI